MMKRQQGEPALISVNFSFLYAWQKVNTIGQKAGEAGNLINYQSIMLDEERLDPHGVGNLPHFFQWQLSSTYGVREMLSMCITDVVTVKVPVYFCCFLD